MPKVNSSKEYPVDTQKSQKVDLFDQDGNPIVILSAGADSLANTYNQILAAAQMYAFNSGTLDRWRNNYGSTVLATGDRNSSTNSADLVNRNARGIIVTLRVNSSTPGGTDTITMNVQAKNTLTGNYNVITDFSSRNAAGVLIGVVYPAAIETLAISDIEVQGIPLPRDFRIRVTHSGSTDTFNYSVEVAYIV